MKNATLALVLLSSTVVSTVAADGPISHYHDFWFNMTGVTSDGYEYCLSNTVVDNDLVGVGTVSYAFSMKLASQFTLLLHKETWKMPKGQTVVFRVQFDDKTPWTIDGNAVDLTTIEVTTDFRNPEAVHHTNQFIADLAASKQMNIMFGGSEPDWTFDLKGSSASLQEWSRCSHAIFQRAIKSGKFVLAPPYTPERTPEGQSAIERDMIP